MYYTSYIPSSLTFVILCLKKVITPKNMWHQIILYMFDIILKYRRKKFRPLNIKIHQKCIIKIMRQLCLSSFIMATHGCIKLLRDYKLRSKNHPKCGYTPKRLSFFYFIFSLFFSLNGCPFSNFREKNKKKERKNEEKKKKQKNYYNIFYKYRP